MNTLTPGKQYLFLGLPLWFRGTLEAETPFAYVLSAEDSIYLADAQTLADYLLPSCAGERIRRRVMVPKDGTFVVEV